MSVERPTVSVCLPVYNGERYVRDAINSVLGQTFTDFELVVSDNGSTDKTEEICRSFAAADPRVRYHRANVNRGLAWNFNTAFALATGRYLTWLAHDDVMAREYVERCVETLEADSGAVLCFSNGTHVDEKGAVVKAIAPDNDGEAHSPSERFKKIIRLEHACDAVFGLMRRDVLRQTRLHGPYADSDRVLLAEMGLRGRFRLLRECLYSRRVHAQRTTKVYDLRERTLIFDPTKAGKTFFPFALKVQGFVSAVHRARLPLLERYRCCRHLARWLWAWRGRLWEDGVEGLKLPLKRHLSDYRIAQLKTIRGELFGRISACRS
jgi:glycosyltransferase involved in cell wall biosynthesis